MHFVFDNSGGSGILVLGVKMLGPDETDATLIMPTMPPPRPTPAVAAAAPGSARESGKSLKVRVTFSVMTPVGHTVKHLYLIF